MIDVTCPFCGVRQPVDASRVGQEIFCEACGAKFRAEAPAENVKTSSPTEPGEFHWEGRPVCRDRLGLWVFGIVLTPVVVGLFFLAKALIHKYSRYYIVTATHIITKHGIMSIETRQIAVKDIRSIEVVATVWQRILGIRRIEISTAGTEGVDITLLGIPANIAEAVQKLQLKQGHNHDD